MSKVSALNGARYEGFALVEEAGLAGMVSLRADLASGALAQALSALGASVPAQRQIVSGEVSVAWMSYDELLILCPHERADAITQELAAALSGEHALVVNVSDARALFRVSGEKADQVLQKLAPVDFKALQTGEIRRSRAAQVAVALWRSAPDQLSLVCFRSVAGYVMGLLEASAQKGGEIA